MQEQINNAINLLKAQEIDGCITGSCLLDYYEGQDIDLFVYNESSFNKLLFFMHYNSLFTILDPLEKYKFDNYINSGESSLNKLGLITIKFKYNLCVDINIIYKKFNNNIFDVISNFDLDIIAAGYDLKTKKTISLRETEGMVGTWNKWNSAFYKSDLWSTKRLLRQFARIVKYTERGYDLTSVTDKYIELVDEILIKENVFKSEKGTAFYEKTVEEFKLVQKILNAWKQENKITPEYLKILQTLI